MAREHVPDLVRDDEREGRLVVGEAADEAAVDDDLAARERAGVDLVVVDDDDLPETARGDENEEKKKKKKKEEKKKEVRGTEVSPSVTFCLADLDRKHLGKKHLKKSLKRGKKKLSLTKRGPSSGR